jgi:hypothetical protein
MNLPFRWAPLAFWAVVREYPAFLPLPPTGEYTYFIYPFAFDKDYFVSPADYLFFTNYNNSDKQAIEAVKAAIKNPKIPSFPLIECEFPPLADQNKLGDGSLRSANQVDDVRFQQQKIVSNMFN